MVKLTPKSVLELILLLAFVGIGLPIGIGFLVNATFPGLNSGVVTVIQVLVPLAVGFAVAVGIIEGYI